MQNGEWQVAKKMKRKTPKYLDKKFHTKNHLHFPITLKLIIIIIIIIIIIMIIIIIIIKAFISIPPGIEGGELVLLHF